MLKKKYSTSFALVTCIFLQAGMIINITKSPPIVPDKAIRAYIAPLQRKKLFSNTNVYGPIPPCSDMVFNVIYYV